MKNHQYKIHPKFIFRIPRLDFGSYLDCRRLLGLEGFKESILLSSPEFYKILDEHEFDYSRLSKKLQLSVQKYGYRISARCSPFGSFSATGVGEFSIATNFYNKASELKLVLSLDCQIYTDAVEKLKEAVGRSATYYTNSSLFKSGKKYRYIKRSYQSGINESMLCEVLRTDYLDQVISAARLGASREAIATLLLNGDYIDRIDEGIDFVDELISDQIIVSELEPQITINNDGKFIENWLDSHKTTEPYFSKISSVFYKIDNINNVNIHNSLEEIDRLCADNKNLLIDNNKNLLKANLYSISQHSTISYEYSGLIEECLDLLNILTQPIDNYYLNLFKSRFHSQYEYEEIPLLEALDPDIGIGFGQQTPHFILSSKILRSILPTVGHKAAGTATNTNVHQLILNKYHKFLNSGNKHINIEKDDLKKFKADWSNAPTTLLGCIEIFNIDEKSDSLMYFKMAGGNSSTNMMGRFYGESEKIRCLVDELIKIEEQDLHETSVFAEIAYQGDNTHVGNILKRSSFRKFEIPVLTGTSKKGDFKIDLNDLYVSLDLNNQIVLKSKKLDKIIIPRNTTAHNYSNSNNAIYYFLSSIYNQSNRKPIMKLNWGSLEPLNGFFPRVTYKNKVILSLGKWKIYKHELSFGDDFQHLFDVLRKEKGIPDRVFIGEDSGILLDFNLNASFILLKAEFKSSYVVLEECLFDEKNPLVKTATGFHANEIIVSFLKQ
ncbi:lantibiotic dehydratase family protein [Pedobacter borealis]|uniref:lantibiotic dehydratase family protein n=1 Tax=Pedobacter borealis TaxID=475254 RepID=UPI0004938715|nr:lantibiotic dehydratase family protein [Pedobacter borealis]